MRVASISLFSDFVGGGEHSLLDLVRHLRPPCQPLLITPAPGPLASQASAFGIGQVHLPMPPLGLASLSALWRWLVWLQAERPALLHANNSRAAIYAGLAGRLCGIPMIFHCRVAERDPRLDWLIGRLATRIVANSHATARRFAPGFADKVETIHNGIELPDSMPEHRPHSELVVPRLLLCAARVSRWKRHDLVLDVFALLAESMPDLHLAMVGGADPHEPDWMEELERRSQAMACGERIHWLGQRDDMDAWYAAADALVLASREEPFGRVVVEAMSCGVPVVAANAGGPAEIIEQGQSGWLVDDDTAEGWAAALQSVLEHGSFRDTLIEGGFTRADEFSLARHVGRMQLLFARIARDT